MTASEIHSLLTAEAARHSLPEYYKDDLAKHDLADLTESGTQSFLWVLRTCGTFLLKLDGKQRMSRQSTAALLKSCECSDKTVFWYHFHAGVLKAVTYREAVALAEEAGNPPTVEKTPGELLADRILAEFRK